MDMKNLAKVYADWDNNPGASNFDMDHEGFRSWQFAKFLIKKQQEFIASYKFEGDEDFGLREQRLFLELIFKFGYAAVIDPGKYLKSKLPKEQKELIDKLGINLNNFWKEKIPKRLPLAFFPNIWDTLKRPIKGIGETVALHNTGSNKTYDLNDDLAAIGQYDNQGLSGYYWWVLPAYQISTADLLIKKRLSTLDIKLVKNDVNNSYDDYTFDVIYDMTTSYINLSPAQTSFTNDKDEIIKVDNLLSQKLHKLDFSTGEGINDLMKFMQEHEQYISYRMGQRINLNNDRNERSITKDFEAMEIYWRRSEGERKEQLELFTKEYKRVFGKEIKLIDLADQIKEELEEQEIRKAGRLEAQQDTKEKTNEKQSN